MSKNCIEQLKALKTHPQAGWVQDVVATDSKNHLMKAIRNHGEQAELVPLSTAGYIRFTVLNSVVRPMGVSAAIFVLIIGGWMTTVSAASNSVPGDALYGLKLVTERAQLTISSLDRRAVLHTEFAERRLHEVVALDVNSEYLDSTWEAFRTEMKMAGDELAQLQAEGGNNVISVASTIDQKIDDLNNGLSQLPGNENTVETKKVAQEVSNSAVGVLVEQHEVAESEDSDRALSQSFKDQYNDLMGRQAFDLGRIAVIKNAVNSDAVSSAVLGSENLISLEFLVKDATDSVSEAMNLAAVGGYRAAFELMNEADNTLLDIEARLAVMEFAVTNELNAVDNQISDYVDTQAIIEEPVQ
ncbi:hypothetical protein CO057_03375 [Candidatus Uhrbacteria bacterium CG_4_9_14_0_2_um_filter_41_50]|uniref:DUF5667 domain-containing protein n=1 Tax=Candidatus Uhrbacteria bacterium CG_4_9_14_0_2_um_filter_41_50 TaxID=1975031 RepID=A0A2M8ENM7_9BACT|nr:MAG: hypothetical protein COZ45_02385 [Candidatus Uhrbacteria bacterium CG_4_10_14_3_um_filter_41_21]PIZ54258.1 MAG: hypothetical protein COY24_04580 [Candidatus Uhrbacteria bacterium CG_4_10_14_0_2_um_filter_41_21]PJB84427.1 MAG: hypothetical protein CO086_03665 [Candidatus Uhrbacteria bacterium CG_4_9_14_0_8_um_filter_41_16]PJC24340.1 MAG: hypothetical protein CO057_03375 [Candidatus Uhrbacteria bacterium CG_4_9_14_0_2_um_filter_41_50]PJE75297.1 MAG: hypothetical protein COV03_00830 [Candi